MKLSEAMMGILIDTMKNRLGREEELRNMLGSLDFIREFGTIDLRLPRRIGKTTALLKMLADLSETEVSAVMVCHSDVARDQAIEYARALGYSGLTIVNREQLRKMAWDVNVRIDVVLFDEIDPAEFDYLSARIIRMGART